MGLRFMRRNVVFEQRIGVSHTLASRGREIYPGVFGCWENYGV